MPLRRACVADRFYSGNAAALRHEVEQFIAQGAGETQPEAVRALIAPHAGYLYSGPCAGYAYARIQGKRPKRVVLLGRSHRNYFPGASVYPDGAFESPLGQVPVDADFCSQLVEYTGASSVEAHELEHSLEVQIPFLQVVLGECPIVPVLFGSEAGPWHVELGHWFASHLDPEDLVVVSTDLSHYLPQEKAQAIDQDSLDRIVSMDYETLIEELASGRCAMCGGTAVVCAMAYATALQATLVEVLDYRTSGEVTGTYEEVVGYGAVSFELHEREGKL